MISRREYLVLVLAVSFGFGGGILSTRFSVASAASPQTIRATRFELVDASGRSIAFWGTDEYDQVIIAFTGGTKSELAAFGLLSGLRGGLRLSGVDTKPRAALVVGQDERPVLGLSDDKGRSRVSLGFITADSLDPHPDTWGLVFRAPGESGHRARAAIGYTMNASGHGWDGSILLEDNAGKVWKAP
jgi:hypothetical protein